MKLNYKEDPNEWRKSILLALFGLVILASLLPWRKHLSQNSWFAVLALLLLVAFCGLLQPRWFRAWYRLSLWLGFYSSRFIGHCVLMIFFIIVITPLGFALRLAGKDLLRLKRAPGARTHWHSCKDSGPMDRFF